MPASKSTHLWQPSSLRKSSFQDESGEDGVCAVDEMHPLGLTLREEGFGDCGEVRATRGSGDGTHTVFEDVDFPDILGVGLDGQI